MIEPDPRPLARPDFGPSLRERLRVGLRNLPSAHHRVMARYLRKRGWVVFYLDECARHCLQGQPAGCWLELYQQGEKQR